MNIFDEFNINPYDDPVHTTSILLERIKCHPEEFKKLSDRAIELGVVEYLSPLGYTQAIQKLAYEMFILSLGMNFNGIPLEEDIMEYYKYDGVGEYMLQMDKIFNMIAFASGKHWDEVGVDLDKWMNYYTQKFISELLNNLN